MPLPGRLGRAIAWYSRQVVRATGAVLTGSERLPEEPAVFVSWHGNNLVALAAHRFIRRRAFLAFVPPGLTGATMAGWLDGVGCQACVPLPPDGRGNVSAALKRMARGLRSGTDVLVAVDGPSGPAGVVRPGALWLARLTGAPLVPMGFAARPSVRYPRWDRHLVPLPGARIAAAIGQPNVLRRGDEVTDARLGALARALRRLDRRADEQLGAQTRSSRS